MAGVVSGHPLDTLRISLQQPPAPSPAAAARRPVSAVGLLRSILATEGPVALYRGMGAPLASVAFQVCLLVSRRAYKNCQQLAKLIRMCFDRPSLLCRMPWSSRCMQSSPELLIPRA